MMRVKADRMKYHKEEMKEMGMEECSCVPVDLYGKLTITEKSQSPGLEKMAEDIKEVYCLEDY